MGTPNNNTNIITNTNISKINSIPTTTLKPKKKAAPKADDFFASVGITAKPTFNSTATTNINTTSTKVSSFGTKQQTSSLSALAAQEDNDYDNDDITDWGDDDDLDDLLA